MEGADPASPTLPVSSALCTGTDVATLAASSVTASITSIATAQTGTGLTETCGQKCESSFATAWDAHLDNPANMQSQANMLVQIARRASLGLTSQNTMCFVDKCEFISLGCFCAVSNALQLLGMKRHSYPFDWVRSSLEGLMHCLDMEFEDFLTYSMCWATDQYVVFGGTRWGGSFWHHNLEAPITKHDMLRRVDRFYGRESVPAAQPRVFVRSVNSSREVQSASRLLDALRNALPGTEVFLLLILDAQNREGLMAISGKDAVGLLFYGITEMETHYNISQGVQWFSETYARAIAAAIKHWSGEGSIEGLRMFANLKELSGACVQFDGGDPGRELFTPRKFFGQYLTADRDMANHKILFAQVQSRNFVVPEHYDVKSPYQVEAFGKTLRINLPVATCGGCFLQLCLNDNAISGIVCQVVDGKACNLGEASITDVSQGG